MARGMILNTAVALCSSMPLQTKGNDSSCRNFMFHANTMSWIDGTCGLARKIETMLVKISSGALKPRFQLSCRTAGGVTKFPVYVLHRHAGAWAITISNQGVSIVLGHTCHNIVYASGCVKVPCCEGGIICSVNQTRKHVFLKGTIHAEVTVKLLQVDSL